MSFVLDDPGPMMWGGELVLRDGVPVGQVTSAAWGETVGSCVGMAYVSSPDAAPVSREFIAAGRYEINVGGKISSATVSLRAPYDPSNQRIRN